MRKFLQLMALMVFLSTLSFAQQAPWNCQPTLTLTTTGTTTILSQPTNPRVIGGQFSIQVTGSPATVAVSIGVSNVDATAGNAIAKLTSTATSGNADLGQITGLWSYYTVTVTTLSGGTAPAIVLRSCLSQGLFARGVGAGNPTPWSSLTAPVGALAIDMGGFATTLSNAGLFTYGGTLAAQKNNIITTLTDAVYLQNNTASTNGVPNQYAPSLHIGGRVWNTTAVAADNWFDWVMLGVPTSGTSPVSKISWRSSLSTSSTPSYTERMSLTDAGVLTATTFVGNLTGTASGNVTGSGTANKAAIFTNTSVIGNSAFIAENGTGVGIGNTAPTTPLDIQGIFTSRSAVGDAPTSPTEGARFSLTGYTPTTDYRNSIFNSVSSNPALASMQFRVASGTGTQATVATLLGNGFAGIGTNAPATAIEIDMPQDVNNGLVKLVPTGGDSSGLTMFPRASGAAANARAWQIANNYSSTGALDFMRSASNATNPGTPVFELTLGGSANAINGYQLNGAAPLNHILVGNGTNYVDSATVPAGDSSLASIDLTAQSAAKTATNLYLPTATGMYRVSYYAKVTTVASISSILGGVTGLVVAYTDGTDSVAQTAFTLPEYNQAGTALSVGTGNVTNTNQAVLHGSADVFAKTGVQMTYAFGYQSTNAAEMVYELHIRVEGL